MRSFEISDFFRALIDQKNNQLHLRVIFCDRVGDVMEQCRFAGARRRDDQTALAHAERRHQVHDAGGVTIGHGLKFDPLVGIDRRKFLERSQTLIFRGILAVDRE